MAHTDRHIQKLNEIPGGDFDTDPPRASFVDTLASLCDDNLALVKAIAEDREISTIRDVALKYYKPLDTRSSPLVWCLSKKKLTEDIEICRARIRLLARGGGEVVYQSLPRRTIGSHPSHGRQTRN